MPTLVKRISERPLWLCSRLRSATQVEPASAAALVAEWNRHQPRTHEIEIRRGQVPRVYPALERRAAAGFSLEAAEPSW